jgi:hypothetical protein
MKDFRTRIIVALASSAVLAGGLSVAVAAVGSGAATVSAAATTSSGSAPVSNITVVDP